MMTGKKEEPRKDGETGRENGLKEEGRNASRDLVSLLRREAKIMLMLLAASLVVFKIVFYNESLLVVGRTVLGFFWLFVLPGYAMMLFWRERLDFLERFVLGTTVAVALIGLTSYYLTLGGLIGIHWQWIVLPIVIEVIVGGIITYYRKRRKLNSL